ncbi:hypothetical protein B0T11DRAFT_355844 [Plectosphaerella cucumerina]|uniref:Uncharacterized protein n=1 Tax=Plectosphaerella cucumerina TaxID=40658 RepID=A0A8K0TCR6_9PEZI|nr:hypothetical protein B0T11DRAFT_355844 [Plectosphaerella cucumerina]
MSSHSEDVGEPMDSQPDTTGDASASQSGLDTIRPVPGIPWDRFLNIMKEFHAKTTSEVDGFRHEDLIYVVTTATSSRSRENTRIGVYFTDNANRQDVISRYYDRIVMEHNANCVSDKQFRLLNSALFWAKMQVADMSVIWEINNVLSTTTFPRPFDELERIFTAWSLQFRIFFTQATNPADMTNWRRMLGQSGQTLERPHSHGSRDRVKAACRKRDNSLCVITHAPNPDVCHVYPMSGINNEYRGTLKDTVASI